MHDDHYIYFLGVVQLATRKKANRTTACPHKLTDFFSVKLLAYSYTRHENPEALQIFCFKFNFFDESSFLLPSESVRPSAVIISSLQNSDQKSKFREKCSK